MPPNLLHDFLHALVSRPAIPAASCPSRPLGILAWIMYGLWATMLCRHRIHSLVLYSSCILLAPNTKHAHAHTHRCSARIYAFMPPPPAGLTGCGLPRTGSACRFTPGTTDEPSPFRLTIPSLGWTGDDPIFCRFLPGHSARTDMLGQTSFCSEGLRPS